MYQEAKANNADSKQQRSVSVDGRTVYIDGEGPETIVMIHGWPDTYRLWDAQTEAMAPHFRCVRFTLPGFEIGEQRRAWSLDEICSFIGRVVDNVSPDAPVTLMLHDWGCAMGYQFYARQPQNVKRIIGIDIGDTGSSFKQSSNRIRAMILGYQVWLALSWIVGGPFGNWMARSMASKVHCPTIGPQVTANQCYPYYMTWFARADSYRRHARRFDPICPMLFMYGQRKPFMFHTARWLSKLQENPANQVVPVDAGHWIMIGQPELFSRTVLEWLRRSESAPSVGH